MARVDTHLASYLEGRAYITGVENIVLRKLFGLKEEVSEQHGILHKKELDGLGQNRPLNTVKTMKSKRLRRRRYAARMDETRNEC
jgi:hypothetical protein